MKRPSTILFVVLVLLLAACSAANPSPVTTKGTESVKASSIPTPQPQKAVVTGKFINKNNNAAVADQLIRLAKIYGTGTESIYVYNETADPGAYTAPDGTVIITDVEPGPYAIILVAPNGNYSPINESSEKILTVDASADQVIDMGDILVDLALP
jgi:hypothetical protein